VNLVGTWKDPAENEKHIAWARKSFDSLGKFAIGRYVNFMGEEGNEGIRAAYGEEKLRRLVALKDKYDPENMFRFNQNVRPSKLDS
jgi:FAD/FMN-containing dehydrogenase